MTENERSILQGVIDDVQTQFVMAVAEGRKLPEADVRAIADGRIFTGQQALALKLVDQLGDLEYSIKAAGTLAKIKGKPHVVKKEKKKQFFEYLKEETSAWIAEAVALGISGGSGKLQYRY